MKHDPSHWKRYEYIPYRVGGVIRVWKKKSQPFFKVLLKDVGKLFKLIVRSYRKELVVGSVLLMGLFPAPQHVKAAPIVKPLYIHTVSRLQPVVAISVQVPPEATPVPEPTPPPAPVAAPVGVTGCGDNMYKQFIYQHESGCRTDAINPIGACGLGQALPCSKMGCSLSDWACQDAFFNSYAIGRYGSWEAAYNYWTAHNYW